MTIPVFDRTLPALAEAVNHAAQVLRNIRDTGGDLSWRLAHDQREQALVQAQLTTQAVLAQVLDAEGVPNAANVAVVTDKLAGYPGAPADGMALLAQFGVVDAAAKALNVFYISWHDALPNSAFRGWDTSTGSLRRVDVQALTEEQARPLRESAELDALIKAFEAVGG
ncbi:hypothetical protein [uncultured Ruegeria sp.]|uniref:hypothetical protein n=1 Tax=uncultured Ruegeria sp. TaxID=259304 RepID=UPI0026380C76|nr:hypothetical protein [uncultured Ruegeria sp.]